MSIRIHTCILFRRSGSRDALKNRGIQATSSLDQRSAYADPGKYSSRLRQLGCRSLNSGGLERLKHSSSQHRQQNQHQHRGRYFSTSHFRRFSYSSIDSCVLQGRSFFTISGGSFDFVREASAESIFYCATTLLSIPAHNGPATGVAY
jgi:hypothetical protein